LPRVVNAEVVWGMNEMNVVHRPADLGRNKYHLENRVDTAMFRDTIAKNHSWIQLAGKEEKLMTKSSNSDSYSTTHTYKEGY
jgi:hypothetical protein